MKNGIVSSNLRQRSYEIEFVWETVKKFHDDGYRKYNAWRQQMCWVDCKFELECKSQDQNL